MNAESKTMNLELVVKTAKVPNSTIPNRSEEKARLEKVKVTLIGTEAPAKATVEGMIGEITKAEERSAKTRAIVEAMGPDVRILSTEILSWRNSEGMPSLVPFSLDFPTTEFALREGKEFPSNLGYMSAMYMDVRDLLSGANDSTSTKVAVAVGLLILGFLGSFIVYHWHSMSADGAGTTCLFAFVIAIVISIIVRTAVHNAKYPRIASVNFTGVIPLKVKEVIEKAKACGHFSRMKPRKLLGKEGEVGTPEDLLFFLADAPEWKVKKDLVPSSLDGNDPLLVGWDGELLWLLATFDTVPLERYIQDEFASKPSVT